MKLTAKIVSIFMVGIVLLTLFHGYVTVRREERQLKQEMEREAHSIGLAMEETIIVQWQQQGYEGVAQLVRYADTRHQQMNIRWVELDVDPLAEPSVPIERLRNAVPGKVLALTSQSHQRLYYPINVATARTGCIEFSEPLTAVHRHTRTTMVQTGTLLLGILLCSGIVTLVGIRVVGRPLEQLIAKTRRIGQGDFSEPLELNSHDELGQLASAVNQMCQQLSNQQQQIEAELAARVAAVEQLRHVDRLKTVGRLASGVAHELGTPLNVVSGRAELIAAGRLDDEQILHSAKAIKSESDRMAKIIRQLLDFARRRSPQRSVVDLGSIVTKSVELISTLAGKRNVKLSLEGTDQPQEASIDCGQIQQALTNLLVNAIQASPDGSTVRISLGSKEASPPAAVDSPRTAHCFIAVEDEGQGIPSAEMEHLFEPFYTTKDVGEGTGLGLSVAHGIVQDHEGWIDVSSEPKQGSSFTIYLPKMETDVEVK
jgi:two-component system, NtrC family, sensor kinase